MLGGLDYVGWVLGYDEIGACRRVKDKRLASLAADAAASPPPISICSYDGLVNLRGLSCL